jgi:glucosylceramidase
VLASSGQIDGVEHVALANPDGSRVLVVTHLGESRQIACGVDEVELQLKLPKDSVTTLVW